MILINRFLLFVIWLFVSIHLKSASANGPLDLVPWLTPTVKGVMESANSIKSSLFSGLNIFSFNQQSNNQQSNNQKSNSQQSFNLFGSLIQLLSPPMPISPAVSPQSSSTATSAAPSAKSSSTYGSKAAQDTKEKAKAATKEVTDAVAPAVNQSLMNAAKFDTEIFADVKKYLVNEFDITANSTMQNVARMTNTDLKSPQATVSPESDMQGVSP